MCLNYQRHLLIVSASIAILSYFTLDGMNISGVSDDINNVEAIGNTDNVGAIDSTNNIGAIDNTNNVEDREMARVLQLMKMMVPPLRYDTHKGQAGRIAVIGGSEEYTGAPYFAAISALKVGADLVHVFCAKEASPVIKSYSPELIVHPILDRENNAEEMSHWLDRMHAVVIGPGLGRLPSTLHTVKEIIYYIRQKRIPLVVDADGLYLITQEPDIIRGYTKAVLTPNVAEFNRLASALNLSTDDDASALSKALEGPVVVKKGLVDSIASPTSNLVVNEPGSPRRCGGQGDLLSGSLATFLFWAHSRLPMLEDVKMDDSQPSMIAAFAACTFTKNCATRAYIKNGRSTTTSDLISEIHPIFSDMFDNDANKTAV